MEIHIYILLFTLVPNFQLADAGPTDWQNPHWRRRVPRGGGGKEGGIFLNRAVGSVLGAARLLRCDTRLRSSVVRCIKSFFFV